MRLVLTAVLVLLWAAPASGASTEFKAIGEASSGVVGDGISSFGYVDGGEFVRLDSRTLVARHTVLRTTGCRVRQMALGAALLSCPDRVTRLVTAAGIVVPVAARSGLRDEVTAAPVGVTGFGDRWLQRFYTDGRYELLQWRTGEVRPSRRSANPDLDAENPVAFGDCGPGRALDRRGAIALVLQYAASGDGTIDTVDCRSKKVTRRLGRVAKRDHVQGQLGAAVATWTSRSTVGVARLNGTPTTNFHIPGAPPASRAPVKAAYAHGRLLVSVTTPKGRVQLLTRTLSVP